MVRYFWNWTLEQFFLGWGQNRSSQMLTCILKYMEQQIFKPKNVIGSDNEQNCILTFFIWIPNSPPPYKSFSSYVILLLVLLALQKPGREDMDVYFHIKPGYRALKWAKKYHLPLNWHIVLILRPNNRKFSNLRAPLFKITSNY